MEKTRIPSFGETCKKLGKERTALDRFLRYYHQFSGEDQFIRRLSKVIEEAKEKAIRDLIKESKANYRKELNALKTNKDGH